MISECDSSKHTAITGVMVYVIATQPSIINTIFLLDIVMPTRTKCPIPPVSCQSVPLEDKKGDWPIGYLSISIGINQYNFAFKSDYLQQKGYHNTKTN